MAHPSLPKALVAVLGRPMLDWVLVGLEQSHHMRVTIVIGFRGEKIEKRYGSRFGSVEIVYVNQRKQEGTAHAIGSAAESIRDLPHVLLAWADILVRPSWYDELWRHWLQRGPLTALHTVVRTDPTTGSMVEFDDQQLMTSIESRPSGVSTGWRDGGISIQSSESIVAMKQTAMSPSGERRMSSTIASQIIAGRQVGVSQYFGPWIDLADSQAIAKAEKIFLGVLH